jgi:hypothetical protein
MSLVEVLVALGLTSIGLAALALMSSGVLAAFAADPAAAEQQQRARATMAVLVEDVARAGAGFVGDADVGPGWGAPAVVPDMWRAGAWSVGAIPSTLGVIGGARTAAHARLASPVAAGEARLVLERPGYCSPVSPTCRFAAGDDMILTDIHGAFALATVRAASPPLVLDLVAPLAQGWPAGTRVSVVEAHGYALRADPVTGLQQIVRASGPGPATALVDFVERFDVEWLVSGAAPVVRDAPGGTAERTTFGPLPPAPGVVGDPAWPAGENCVFARDAVGRSVSRLAPIGAGAAAVPISRFADGPWCPSAAAATRWDADLARVVGVRMRIDLAVASAWLRAPLAAGSDPPRARFRQVPRLTVTTLVAPGRAAGVP